MSGDPGKYGSARAGLRRRLRQERTRDSKITMRHRWYAGGVAALLSGALVFTGVTPAIAEVVPPPPASETADGTATSEETPAEETPAEETPAEETPAKETPAKETPAEETPAEETPAEEAPAKPAPTQPKGQKPSTDSSKAAAPEQDAVVAPLAVIPGCTSNCSTIIRNASISGGGPAAIADWEYRATDGADWYVLPNGGAGINVARDAYVISAVSLNGNTANYTTTVSCTDPGSGVSWSGGTSTLTFSGGTARTSTCTFTHTYVAPQSATITVKVGSDRTGVTGVTDLSGVGLHLRTAPGSGPAPRATRADGVAGDGAGWARCVSNATGNCVFTVPSTQPGGTNAGTRPWLVQFSAPTGYYMNPNLRTGGASGAGDSTAYQFRMKVGLSGSTAYSSQNVAHVMLGSGTEANASGGIWQQSRVNPSLTPSCGLDVALILDVSGSVGDALPNLKQAANTFVDSLVGTQSRMSLFSFSWESPGSEATQNYPNLTPVTTPAQGTAFKGLYSGWGSEGGTNWDRGLGEAAAANTGGNQFDVAVIITDGNPTTYNDPYQGSGSNNRFRETEAGIFSANAIKAAGTRLLAFGVGAGATGATNSLNLRAISGPTAYNGSNGASADFYQTADYAAVGTALRNLALGNCAGSLNVTKMIVPSTAPAGSTAGAVPSGAGWQFNSTINTPGVTTPNASRTTTADGTGTVNFPLTFPGGTTTAGLTIAEVQQSGFTLQQVSGSNAVCTNLSTNTSVPVTNSGALGFTVNVPSTQSVNCVVYNRAPSPEADITVSKTWVVNGVSYPNGNQPGGLSAQLRLTGPNGAAASNQGWGVTRSGYTQGDDVTISETVTLIDPAMCTNVAKITSLNGSPADITLGAGYVMDLALAHNVATITNTVTCESRLTLVKDVANGTAAPTAWTLNAQFLAGQPVPTGLPGFSGVSGTGAVTSQPVTPNARYQLFEQGGDARYKQNDDRTNLQSNPASTGSATCIRVEADGDPWPASGYSDGINGGVNVPLGFRVQCTLTNETAQLTLLKHVINDNGGTATAPAWTLVATPAAFTGLNAVNVPGSETSVPASTFLVRPDHTYTISETGGPAGYTQVKLQRFQGGTWVDVAGWNVSVPALGGAIYRVVNDDVAPKLTLVKTVTNDNGGTAIPTAWTLTATTPGGPDLSGATGSGAVTAQSVEAGTPYTLGETGPGGYDWNTLSCTGYPNTTKAAPTLTLKAGDNVTCTFNNNDQPGSLTLVKVVNNANGGSAVAADWNGKLTAKRGADTTLAFNHNETKQVPAGTYSLAEINQIAGYQLSSLVCSTGGTSIGTPTVVVANGANVTCTFTNTSQKPTLTLEKLVVNDGGGSATASQWTLTATSNGSSPINGTGTQVGQNPLLASISGQVTAGVAYTLSETGPSGYAQSGPWTCVVSGTQTPVPVTAGAVTVPLATNVTCRVVNNDVDATGSVAKSAGTPVQQADGTWTIQYTVTVTNNSASAAYAYTLNDTFQFGGGITVGTPSVISSPPGVTLTPGWNGAAQSQLATGTVPAGGPSHVYTIRVTGITIADGTQDGETWMCQPGETPGAGGFLNRAQIFKPGATVPAGTAYACKEPSFPTITKVAIPATQNPDASWNLGFTITIANPGDVPVQATLTDAFPSAPTGWALGGGVWNVAQVAGAPIPVSATYAPGVGTAWSGILPAGTSYSYTVSGSVKPTVNATIPGSCESQDGGFLNKATIVSGDIVEDSEGCISVLLPPVTVSKTDGTVTQLANGDWQIDYTVTVNNPSDVEATVYTLTDAPDLGTGFTVVPAGTGWVGGAPAAETPIEAGGSDEYVYRVIARFDEEAEEPELECVPGQGGAFYNVATVTFPGGEPVSDDGCAEPGAPTVTKTAGAPTPGANGSWTLTYEVVVGNTSGMTLAYTLDDVPFALPSGVTLTTPWTVTGPVEDPADAGTATLTDGWNGDDQTEVATGTLPDDATHTYTVTAGVTLTTAVDPADLECGETPAENNGLWNTTTVTNGVFEDSDDACIEVQPVPVTVEKSDGTVTQLAGGTWQIDYQVTVANANALPSVYSLTDAPQFDATSYTVQTQGWVGSPDVTDVAIEAGGSDVYTYRVTATTKVDPVPQSGLVCTENGGGFFNTATVTYPGGSDSDSGCAVPAKPSVDKTAAVSVQDAETGEWTLSYEVAVANTTGIQLWYSLTDTPDALPTGVTGGAWTASGPVATGGGSGTRNAAWNGDDVTQLATGLLPTGATHTYTVTRTVEVAASVDSDALDCQLEGSGIWNSTTVTNGVGGNDDTACAEIERPGVTIDKTVTDTAQLVDGTWEITYDVVVTNESADLAAVYDLDDTLVFGGDIEIVDASWTGPSGDGDFAGPAWTDALATDQVVEPGDADTYTVTAHATVDEAAWDGDTLACQDGERPGAGGFLNTAVVTVNGEPIFADDCSEPELPAIEKVGVAALQDPDDASRWTVEYLVTVTSGGYDTFYDLSDTPAFASGVDIISGSAQLLPDGDVVDVEAGVDFVEDAALPAGATHEYKVVWTVDITDEYSENSADCTGEPGSGFFNTATLTVGDIPQSDEDCIPVVDRVYPVPSKTVTSTSQDPETGQWIIEYELEVTLAENEQSLSAEYDLTDELLFGGDIDIDSATWSGEGTTDEPFEPDGTAVIATDKTIGSGDTHTYTVTVVATVTATAIEEGTITCYPDASEPNGGFLNTALLTSGGQEVPVDDCSEPAFPEIDKVGGVTTDNGDGTYEIEYLVTVSYPVTDLEPAPSPVGYTLTDAPALPAGVDVQGSWDAAANDADTPDPTDPTWDGAGVWTVVDGGELTPENPVHTYRISATVLVTAAPEGEPEDCMDTESSGIVIWNVGTVTSGEYVVDDDGCQVVHFDDVGIEKTSVLPEGQTSVEPGDTFDYVLTVTNHGSRPATDVRVTDDDINERLDILGLTVSPAMGWGVAPGYTEEPNDVDLTLDTLGVGESATITIEVEFLPAEPVLVDHDGDPATPPIIPPVVGDDELPEAPDPLDSLENTACVSTTADPIGGAKDGDPFAANCDDEEIPTRDIAAMVYTRCVNDAPFLGWVVTKSASLVGEEVELEWHPDNPDVTPETTPASVVHTQPGGSTTWSQEITWPGAAFTPSGISIDYPGWRAIRAADIASPTQYFLPGTNVVMTPAQQSQFVFNGLILDPSELDFAWRGNTEITISVNPELTFSTGYPPATPECFVARHTELQIDKSASVERTQPGGNHTYDLAVANVSTDSAAEGVVVTDEIPADIKITGISWPGEGDASVFPNWESCEVTGEDAEGFGGTLECVLFGPLQPQGSDNGGASAAPTITLSATVHSLTKSSVITNVAFVDYHTFGDPDDAGRDSDDATVLLSSLPATGGGPALPLVMLGFIALLAGVATVVVMRRRRGERKPVL